MPLEPKHEYTAKIYAELLSSIGMKVAELAGQKEAGEIFKRVASPVGEKDARKIAPLIGVKKGNAASAALQAYAAADILSIDISISKLDPRTSQVKIEKCPYGDAVMRQKNPLICKVCYEYSKGMAETLGVKFVRGEMVISSQHSSCFETFMCLNPAEESIPSLARADFIIKMLKLLTNKNDLLISTLSTLFINLSDETTASLGEKKALAAAKNAYSAGEYQGPLFAAVLGLGRGTENAAKLISAVRETTACKTSTYLQSSGFLMYTKDCPQRSKCTSGGFIEAACTEYSLGLISKLGSYEAKCGREGIACKQEFLQASPPKAGGKNAP